MLYLRGTTSIVTGGTSGIGYATANELVQRGANLVVNSRSANSALAELAANAERKAFVSCTCPATCGRPMSPKRSAHGRFRNSVG